MCCGRSHTQLFRFSTIEATSLSILEVNKKQRATVGERLGKDNAKGSGNQSISRTDLPNAAGLCLARPRVGAPAHLVIVRRSLVVLSSGTLRLASASVSARTDPELVAPFSPLFLIHPFLGLCGRLCNGYCLLTRPMTEPG